KYNDRDSAMAPILSRKRKSAGVELTRPEIQTLAEMMLAASMGVTHLVPVPPIPLPAGHIVAQQQVSEVITMQLEPQDKRRPAPVAIFCALEEEREYLIDRWKLPPDGDTIYWRGPVEGVECLLYTADEMGRGPAALATMQMLRQYAPEN